jgi:hypothetical protein
MYRENLSGAMEVVLPVPRASIRTLLFVNKLPHGPVQISSPFAARYSFESQQPHLYRGYDVCNPAAAPVFNQCDANILTSFEARSSFTITKKARSRSWDL